MSVLVIAQHNNQTVNDSVLNTVSAASQLSDSIDIIVMGSQCDAAASDAASISGVSKVIKVDNPLYEHLLAENVAPVIVELASQYSHILIPSNTFGKNIMPRIAALLDVSQVTDVMEVISQDTFKRPIYAGNAIATVQTSDSIKLLTIRTTAFDKSAKSGGAEITTTDGKEDQGLSVYIGVEGSDSKGPDLTSARVVISGGRGMGSAENFDILRSLAAKIGDCAIGASRAAVDAGYVPNDYQVGQTGKIVAPELYVAVGISGAIQHLAGMKDSKIIVAINKDENAPIFEVADFGIVADLFDVIPELESLIS